MLNEIKIFLGAWAGICKFVDMKKGQCNTHAYRNVSTVCLHKQFMTGHLDIDFSPVIQGLVVTGIDDCGCWARSVASERIYF